MDITRYPHMMEAVNTIAVHFGLTVKAAPDPLSYEDMIEMSHAELCLAVLSTHMDRTLAVLTNSSGDVRFRNFILKLYPYGVLRDHFYTTRAREFRLI